MKIFAIHDTTGAISAIVTAPDQGASISMVTDSGSQMTEVELPMNAEVADGDEEGVSRLADVVAQYRVVHESKVAKLEPQ
ncbi:MAG: hypothetical protein QOH04_103 [Sphingomonadales bacterium]|jgi:hypothetical protein|nr:hypothetical protein [Sphingomonadales bacterium]MEA3034352.1 hypothetical protein [Sphingomonadales bacterium]